MMPGRFVDLTGKTCSAALSTPVSWCAVLLLLIAFSTFARAQSNDGGPIIIGGGQEKRETLHFEPPSIALDLQSTYRQDESRSGGDNSSFRETFFSEALSLKTTGYLYSPNFFDIKLKADVGLTQSFSDGPRGSDSSGGELLRWDASGIYRKTTTTPITVFSQRDQQWIHREFGPTLQTTTEHTGVRLDWRIPKAPTQFEVSHLNSTQEGIEGSDDFSYTRDRFAWYTVYKPSRQSTFNGNYQFNRVNQQGSFDAQYDTHDLSLSNEYLFGKNDRNSLTTSIDYRLQTGDLELQTFRFMERLRLRHTDKFETFYDYRFDYYDYPQTDRLRHTGRTGFLHRLYQSLVTTGGVTGSYTSESPSDFSSTEIQGDLNFAYKKKVFLGKYFADLGLRRNIQNNSERGETTFILDQNAGFNDPLPLVIPGVNVDPNSIVITDPGGLLIYEEGIDYSVTRLPDRVEINRIVGGRIPNLSNVLIDYGILPTAANTTTTDNLSLSMRYELDETFLRGLGIYGRYGVQSQEIDTDAPGDFIENGYTDWLYGIDYRVGGFTIGAEHQIHDSDIVPYEATRYYARYLTRRDRWTFGANVTYTLIHNTDIDNHVELFSTSTSARYAVNRRLTLSASVLYRDQHDDLGTKSRGFEQTLDLQWQHRQTLIYAQIRNSQLETETDRDDFQFFMLGLRREF